MPTTDEQFLQQQTDLLNCLCAALASRPNPPAKCCLTWGDPIADIASNGDDCCSGTAYVRMLETYPSFNFFPDRTIERQSGPCGVVAWALPLEVTVFRCWPTPPNTMDIVSCADLTAATEQMVSDVNAVREAMCCLRDINRRQRQLVSIGAVSPIDPLGGCAGVQGTLTIQIPQCSTC
jgi:hypothetical protein